jgi:hypothetical protein
MKAKICFNNEIHRIANLPEALSGLKDIVSSLFKATLPQSWTLQYIDCEGDKIVIGNEHDYVEMKNWGVQGNQASSIIKIFVESSQFGNLSEIKKDDVLSAKSINSQDEDYLVINGDEQDKPEVPKSDLSQSLSESASSKEEALPVKEEIVQKEEKQEISEENPLQHAGEGKVLVDLAVLEKMMENMIQKSLPVVVEVTKESLLKEKKEDEVKKPFVRKPVHYGVSCTGCGALPIVGTRYKCSVCPCFDFCENCEENRTHMHNFIKMKERDVFDMFRPNTGVNSNNHHNNKPKEHVPHHKKYQPYNVHHNNNNNAQKKPIGDSENPRFRAVKGKAEKLKERFPHASFEILLAYVSGCPDDFNMDELIENYKI